MSLLNTKTGFTTPWHCSVALMADGEWISAPMGEFLKDPKMKIVHENGRPSYFQEMVDEDSRVEDSLTQAVKTSDGKDQDVQEHQGDPSTTISSSLAGVEEEKITELAKSISACEFRDGNGKLVNPFIGSDDPQLDPNSGQFAIKAWLQAVMNIASRDPDRHPRGAVGVAYRDLSAHGVGEVMDYQKTFGNYPLGLMKAAKNRISMGTPGKIQILRNFDGLVKSGEMLLVLGRPGRQVILWTAAAQSILEC